MIPVLFTGSLTGTGKFMCIGTGRLTAFLVN